MGEQRCSLVLPRAQARKRNFVTPHDRILLRQHVAVKAQATIGPSRLCTLSVGEADRRATVNP